LKPNGRIVAACQVFLVVPALLFLVALLARGRQPIQTIVALDAQAIVTWYAARQWTLWLLLIALPAAALIIGFFDLAVRSQSSEQRSANPQRSPSSTSSVPASTLIMAAGTALAVVDLAVVALHMMMN